MTVPGPAAPFRNILFATDFSPCSEAVFLYAAALARQCEATLYSVHVIQGEVLNVDPPVIDQLRESAVQQMHDLETSEMLQDVPFHPVITEGVVGATVAEVARQNDVDVIIVGTHGRTGMRKFVMGSVAEDIVRHAPCPVIALGPQVCTEARYTPAFKRVLYATDLTPDSSARFSRALTVLKPWIEHITLMHVISSPPITDGDTARNVFRNNLLRMVPADSKLPTAPEAIVDVGTPADIIVEAAKGRKIDVIMLGVHPPGVMGTHLMHTAYRVMIDAPCPVLLVAAATAAAEA